jgi:hypothetical protein
MHLDEKNWQTEREETAAEPTHLLAIEDHPHSDCSEGSA